MPTRPAGLSFRWYRATTATTYATNTSTGLVFSPYAWRWIAMTGDIALGTSLKARFYASGLDDLVRPLPLGTLTEGAGAQNSDAAASLKLGLSSGIALSPGADIAFCGLWGGVLSPTDLHRVQRDIFAGRQMRVPTLGLWLPGHNGQSVVPDFGPLGLHGTITGAVAKSGGVPGFWAAPSGDGGRAPTATTFTQTLSGGLTPAGSLVRQAAKGLAGGVTPAGSLSTLKVVILTLAGALTPAGALIRRATRVLAGSLSPAGSAVKRATRVLSAGLTPSGALASLKVVIVALAGSLAPAGGVVRQAVKQLGGALTPAAALTRRTTRLLSGGIAPAGAVVRRITKGVAGSLTPVATVVTSLVSGGARLMKLVASVAIKPFAAAHGLVRPALDAGAKLRARLGGSPDIGPEA
jgi:hypothetical protein